MQELEKKMELAYQEDDLDLSEQMEEFADESNNYMLLEMETCGMACGPCSSNEYLLINLK